MKFQLRFEDMGRVHYVRGEKVMTLVIIAQALHDLGIDNSEITDGEVMVWRRGSFVPQGWASHG